MVKKIIVFYRQKMRRASENTRIHSQEKIASLAYADMPLWLRRFGTIVEYLDDNSRPQHGLEHRKPGGFCQIVGLLLASWVIFVQKVFIPHPTTICRDIRPLFMG